MQAKFDEFNFKRNVSSENVHLGHMADNFFNQQARNFFFFYKDQNHKRKSFRLFMGSYYSFDSCWKKKELYWRHHGEPQMM